MSSRTLLAALAAVSIFSSIFASASARAYEVLEYRSSEQPRVAVIVLAYEEAWWSYAGEAIFDGYLHLLMKKRYSKLFVSRGKGLSATDVQDALRAAFATGMTVDFMTSTHSSSDAIALQKSSNWIRPEDLIAPVLNDTNREQLEMAANFGCYSDGQVAQFDRLGFKSYVAHEGVSAGAVAMRAFLKRWLHRCDDLMTAVEWTDGHLHRFFTKNPIAKAIYKALSGEKEYAAVLKSFGQNIDVCR